LPSTRRTHRLVSLLAAALLALGGLACAPDETREESDMPGTEQETGEGAGPEGGVGEDGVEGEGALD
jgi:hypothetical protein